MFLAIVLSSNLHFPCSNIWSHKDMHPAPVTHFYKENVPKGDTENVEVTSAVTWSLKLRTQVVKCDYKAMDRDPILSFHLSGHFRRGKDRKREQGHYKKLQLQLCLNCFHFVVPHYDLSNVFWELPVLYWAPKKKIQAHLQTNCKRVSMYHSCFS